MSITIYCQLHLRTGEDFQLLSKMQKNFDANPNLEVIIGRHEAALADRHRWYRGAVSGHY